MFDVIEMPWAWPVDVNYHEAKAFCAWKGQDFRLLIEAENNVIRGKQVWKFLLELILAITTTCVCFFPVFDFE